MIPLAIPRPTRCPPRGRVSVSRPSWLPLSILAATLAPTTANAQTTAAVAVGTSAVELHAYQPTPFGERFLRLDRTAVLPRGEFRLGADVDYALRPLVLEDAMPGIFQVGAPGPEHVLIEHAVSASLAASLGLGHHLELALAVPVTLYQTGQTVPGVDTPSLLGVGNAQIGLKAGLFARAGLGAGAAILLSAPRGLGTFTAENGWSGEGRLFGDYERGRWSFGARAGLRLRQEILFEDTRIGNELGFATGAALALGPRTSLMAELAGSTPLASPFGNLRQSPVEALAGLRRRIGKTWFTLAGGPGLTDGYGSPVFRVVAGVTWANRPPDADLDGIPDDDDRCPRVPEDKDGFEDADGCPDPDNDADGIPDPVDRCPNVAEDKDGFEDADGCPDPDNDKDGILDGNDKCPDKPETVNGFEDADGCPDEAPKAVPADSDKDGILDDDDECPEEPEDKDGFEDADGCPDPDNDKDGILDAVDRCPLEPETINGVEDADGCPDAGKPEVRLGPHEIETLKPIFFATDRARVRHAFFSILAQVASLMKAHPEIGRVGIEGHTDATGPADWNQHLSVRRANAVVDFLVGQGIARERLVPVGHAEKLPWASNETPWGRAQNRRVVFHVEGVNPEAVKKDEARQERRRHIHRHHEKDPPPGADRSGPAKPAASVEEDGAADRGRAAVAPEEAPSHPEAAASAHPHPAEAAKARAAPASKRPRGAIAGASAPAAAGSRTDQDDDAEDADDTAADKVADGASDDATDQPPAKKASRKRWPTRLPRPAPKPMFTGPAPTLRELLVLPPR
jgi:outer membrane protein OmpA-like peptidoglycan-associated protein